MTASFQNTSRPPASALVASTAAADTTPPTGTVALATGATLVVTCDCGSSDHPRIQAASDAGSRGSAQQRTAPHDANATACRATKRRTASGSSVCASAAFD